MKTLVTFEDVMLELISSKEHEFTLTTKEVAKGYGVSTDTVRQHKSANHIEFVEGKHFLSSVSISHGAKGTTRTTLWTKRGIIRLGFFIKSDRARLFRDFIEDLTMYAEKTIEEEVKSIFDFAGIDFSGTAQSIDSTVEEIEGHSKNNQDNLIEIPAHKYIALLEDNNSLLEYKIAQLEKQQAPKRLNLTPQEIKQIRIMARQGHSVQEIAKHMGRSTSSVRKFAGSYFEI